MREPEVDRAVDATVVTVAALGLAVESAIVLHNSNKLALRLLPCDVLARVAPIGQEVARFEVELAQRLAATGSPVAALEPRVAPRVHERDGFAITLWTYYEPQPATVAPADDAEALARLHAGLRTIDIAAPHFTDRVAEARQLVERRGRTAVLTDEDRELLADTMRDSLRAIGDRGAAEQLLHGEPHPGNVLRTKHGPRFIDLETVCRGPVEFDLAHVPETVADHYPGADRRLLVECRLLVLAMVTAWRCDPDDQFPDRERARQALLRALHAGPPWPTLDAVWPGAGRR